MNIIIIKNELKVLAFEIRTSKTAFNISQKNGGGKSITPLRAVQNKFRSKHIALTIFRKFKGKIDTEVLSQRNGTWIMEQIEFFKIETKGRYGLWNASFNSELVFETLYFLMYPTAGVKKDLLKRRSGILTERASYKEKQRNNGFACFDQLEADKNDYRALHVAYTICKKNQFDIGDNNIYHYEKDWINSQIKKFGIETPNKAGKYKDYFNYTLCWDFMIQIQNGEI